MNILKATKRTSASTGQVNKLRSEGFIPAVLYGGKKSNLNISLKKLQFQDLIRTETFMSKVFDLDINGNPEKVLPREIAYDPVSDEPIHIDFIRIVEGSVLSLEIPVKFINNETCPGLKRGGVLNIVRRKVELKCPTENIPTELVVDLEGLEIGDSIKISSINLPENVKQTIQGRDFVIAGVAAPTIFKEPEKPAEGEAAEGAEGTEGTEGTEATATEKSEEKAAEGDKAGDKSKEDQKKEEKTPPEKK